MKPTRPLSEKILMFNHQTSPGDKMRVTWPLSRRFPRGSLWTVVVSVESRHLEKRGQVFHSSNDILAKWHAVSKEHSVKFRIQRRFMNKCKNLFLLALDDNRKMDCIARIPRLSYQQYLPNCHHPTVPYLCSMTEQLETLKVSFLKIKSKGKTGKHDVHKKLAEECYLPLKS